MIRSIASAAIRVPALLALTLFIGGSLKATAFSEDELFLEFDARTITTAEKRFLQTGLALNETYNAMLDGAWGTGSQRALERDIPQNVNFAIRGEIAKLFLFQNDVEPILSDEGDQLAPEDLAEKAKGFTRFIECNR